ncbi:MAG: gliding motility protein GldN [Bacteroidota bacterium]
MKAKRYLLALIACFGFVYVIAQPNTTITPGGVAAPQTGDVPPPDVYKRENIIPEKKPVPYAYIREADVMWAKDIWRTVDLRERMNQPLQYPIDGHIGERYSLYGLLLEGIRSEEITPYKFIDWNNPFAQRTSLKQIYQDIEADTIFDDNGKALSINAKNAYIKQFILQEKWFFDKQHSVMRVRIVAIAPVMIKNKEDANGNPLPDLEKRLPFVVYFPQCRRMFATHPVYNGNNDAQNISFDDLFFQRRFASTISAESNVYANRFIVDYLKGQDALMEAERIKEDLFDMEHDLWEY